MNIRQQQAALFQALGNPVRLQILEILSQAPRCVCDLVTLTGKRQPCVSQNLAILREVGLVRTSQQGKKMIYHINVTTVIELNRLISTLSPSTSKILLN
ncbi:MAG: winged helix-turn-helix transcriptional regulator [Chloroflexi bacterium]|nr:winged helix-turn-helix transcriptional regulator [Chloroflexota bacterium]